MHVLYVSIHTVYLAAEEDVDAEDREREQDEEEEITRQQTREEASAKKKVSKKSVKSKKRSSGEGEFDEKMLSTVEVSSRVGQFKSYHALLLCVLL